MTILAVALAGCPSGDATSEDTLGESISPVEGTWSDGEAVFDEDGCGLEGTGSAGTFEITLVEGGFQVVDGDSVTTCALGTGGAFTCDPLTVVETIDPLDAEVTSEIALSGSFSAPDAGMFEVFAQVSCEGADCAELGELDGCTTRFHYPITAGG